MSRTSTIRWSDHGKFSVIPEWLIDADVSDRAIRLFAVLGRYADQTGQAMPSRKTLAKRLHCSTSTLDVALADLREIGALSWSEQRREDGGRTSNDYVLHPTPLTDPSVGGDRQGGKPPTDGSVGNELDVEGTRQGETTSPPTLVKIEGRNVAFDALCEVCHVDTRNRRRTTEAAGALREIRGYVWDDLDEAQRLVCCETSEVFERRLAATIRDRAKRYADAMPGAQLTPSALAKWWHDVLSPRAGGATTAAQAADLLGLENP